MNPARPKTARSRDGPVDLHGTETLKEEMAVTAEKAWIAGVDLIADGIRIKGRQNVKT
jgi:hypothetical protein